MPAPLNTAEKYERLQRKARNHKAYLEERYGSVAHAPVRDRDHLLDLLLRGTQEGEDSHARN